MGRVSPKTSIKHSKKNEVSEEERKENLRYKKLQTKKVVGVILMCKLPQINSIFKKKLQDKIKNVKLQHKMSLTE